VLGGRRLTPGKEGWRRIEKVQGKVGKERKTTYLH